MSKKIVLDKDVILSLSNEGYTRIEIANMLGVSLSCLQSNIKRLDILMYKDDITKAQKLGVKRKYGVENVGSVKEIRDKAMNTWRNKTGLDNPYKDPNMLEKKKQTCIDKYGVDSPVKDPKIKEKISKTNIDKYLFWISFLFF